MTEKKSLIIVGGGGFCREVIWLARETSSWDVIGILDDNPVVQGESYCNVAVLGTVMDWTKFGESWFVVAIGSPRTRKKVVEKMLSMGSVKFASLQHPSVLMSEYVTIGAGSIITAGCILTSQVTLGQHTIVNLASTIGHDVKFGNYCTVAPQVAVSGNVTADDGIEFGTGSIILQGISIETGAFIGAGALVSKNITSNILVVGSPARQIKSLDAF